MSEAALRGAARLPGALRFTVLHACASKANSRRLVRGRHGLMSIKSPAALAFVAAAARQIPTLPVPLDGPVALWARLVYGSHRPDLDEALVMDALQGRLIKNDRQIVEKHIWKAVDPRCPRVEGIVVPVQPALSDLSSWSARR